MEYWIRIKIIQTTFSIRAKRVNKTILKNFGQKSLNKLKLDNIINTETDRERIILVLYLYRYYSIFKGTINTQSIFLISRNAVFFRIFLQLINFLFEMAKFIIRFIKY